MCSGKAPALEEATSFVGRWMDILRPTYEKVAKEGGTDQEQVSRMEHEGILASIENLMTFPFISDRVLSEELAIHAVILDISDGTLEQYEPAAEKFVAI